MVCMDNDTVCIFLQSLGFGQNSSSTTAANDTKDDVNDIGEHVYAYTVPFIIIIGLVGNVLSLCVFTSRQLRKLSASLYLVAISTSDTIVLLSYVLLDWLAKHLHRWPGAQSVNVINITGVCETFVFISYSFRFISVYLIVVFTIERFIAVCRPLHRRRICTKSFAHRIILTVHLLGATLSITKPLISGVVVKGLPPVDVNATGLHVISDVTSKRHEFDDYDVDPGQTVIGCGIQDDFKDVNYVLELIYGLSITIVPFCIITILNVLILRKLLKGDNLNNNKTTTTATTTFMTRNRIRIELTITLIGISSAFIILNLPYFIVWLKRYFQHDDPNPDIFERTRNYLYIAKTVFIINYSINFFIYCMTGTYYRGVIKRILMCSPESSSYMAAMPSDSTMKTEVKDSPGRSANGIRLTPPSELLSLAETQDAQL